MTVFVFGNLFSQQNSLKVYDFSTKFPVEKVRVYKDTILVAISDKNGLFLLKNEFLPGIFVLKVFGFEEYSVFLEINKIEQHLYLIPTIEQLSEVVVQSTLINQTVQKTAASVNILDSADFNRTDATNLLESFNNTPGIVVSQGALNTNKINIRGIGSRSQYSTNRIQAFFDGIPLTTAEGELTLDDFDQETIEKIEIIKGPTSSVYGAGLGGAINLFSKKNSKKGTSAKSKNQFGSFNTQKQVLQILNRTEKNSLTATFTNLTSDGSRENGNYNRKSALINGTLTTSRRGKLIYLANFTRLKAFIPSSLNEIDFMNNPEIAAFSWKNAQGYESYDRGLLGTSYTHSFVENFTNTTSVFLSFRNAYEPRPFDILDEKSTSIGVRTQFNRKIKLFEMPSEISLGGIYYNEMYETGTFKNLYQTVPNSGSIQGDRLTSNKQNRNYANFFMQMNIDLTEKWNLDVGYNVNTTNYRLADLLDNSATSQTGSYRFKTIFSPRIASSYSFSKDKNIYVSVSQGFSTPSVAETLTPEGLINTQLKPELGTNYEIGFKGNWINRKLYTELALYSIQITNLLVAERISEDQYVGLNAGKTSHNGIEFLTNYRFKIINGISIQPYLSAALQFFKFKEFTNNDTNFNGNKLPGVPDYTLNFGMDFLVKDKFQFNTTFRSLGAIPLNDANSVYSNSYNLVNLKANYYFMVFQNLSINVYAGINNAFDERYAASILTNAVGFGSQLPRYYYPGNPRNYFGGLQLNYIF